MKQFLIRTTVLMIVVITVCCLSSACAESISVGDSKTFAVTLTDSPPFKKGTVLLDNNVTLRSHSERALMLQIQSLVIDGQDHALTPGANVSQDDEISLPMRDTGYLKLQNISDLGNMSVFGLKGTVEFENVMLTGNSYTFLNAHATLSSADTAVRDKAGKPSSIYVSKTLSSQKPKLVLDENCRIAENWMLRTVNAELQVDCDYYDAEVEAFAKGSVSFSGKASARDSCP